MGGIGVWPPNGISPDTSQLGRKTKQIVSEAATQTFSIGECRSGGDRLYEGESISGYPIPSFLRFGELAEWSKAPAY